MKSIKKIQENYEKKVYEVIVDFNLKDDGFFTLRTVGFDGDTAVDEIIKKCKNKEVVTYEITGKEEIADFECDGIELQYKTLYFKYFIKGVFRKFEFNEARESYTIKVAGELLSAKLEYTKEEGKNDDK